jgi:autotransporter-associated beta strand protein
LDLGGGSVIKEGAGTLILVDANTYSGGTILDSLGALDIRHAGALGSGPVTIKNDSVMFIRDLKGTPLNNDFTVEGFGVASKFGAIGNDDGNNTLTGKITLSGDACITSYHKGTSLTITGDIDGEHNLTLGIPKEIDYDWGAGDMFISGAIKTGAGSVYKKGSGTVTLSGANTYTGETRVYDGTLRIGSDFSGKINFSGDAFVEALNGKSITGDLTTDTSGTGTLTLSGGNQNINGDIGAGNALKAINIDSGLAKTATFSGTVTAQNINMRGLGTAAFGNNITGAVNFVENGIVALAPGKTITGAVDNTSGVADAGTLKFLGGSQSVSGDIGSTNMLHLVDIAAGMTTFGGNINTATLNFSGNGTAIIASGKSITGDITTDNSGDGTLTLAGGKQNVYGTIGAIGKALNAVNFNGTTTLYNNIYAANTNINSGSNVITNGNRNVNGNLNVSGGGTLIIGSTQMQVSGGAFSSANNSAINVEISQAASGKIQATGAAASVNAGTSLFVNVIGHIPQNNQLTIIEGAPGGSVGALTNITDDSRRFYFTQVANTDNLILLSHRYTTFAADGKNANTRAIGATIDSIDAAGAVGDMLTIIDTLDTLDDTGITKALESMSPKVDSGAINNSTTMLNNFVNVSIERTRNALKIAQNKWHNTMTDISAGDEELYNGFWAKGYGSRLNQNSRKGIQGYDAWNAGTAFGIDRIFKDVAIIGISGGWTYGKVDSDTNDSNTRINSAQTTLYGGYRDNKYPFFMDASTSFAWNWYKARRRIAFANIDRVADASYDGQQYGAYLGGGYDFEISKNVKFTPLASLQWMHLHMGGYKETNAGSLNLDVKSQDYDILQSGLGASISGSFDFKWGSIVSEVHGKWLYDFFGDKVVMTSTFTGGGGAFDSKGYSPAQNSFNIGCKLGVDLKNNISLLSEFNTELKDKFFGIYGAVTLRYNF